MDNKTLSIVAFQRIVGECEYFGGGGFTRTFCNHPAKEKSWNVPCRCESEIVNCPKMTILMNIGKED